MTFVPALLLAVVFDAAVVVDPLLLPPLPPPAELDGVVLLELGVDAVAVEVDDDVDDGALS